MIATTIRVLVKCVLNGIDDMPLWVNPGDIVSVMGGPYAQRLIEKGFVTLDVKPPVVPQLDEPEATAAARAVAAQHGIDLRKVTGTGIDGRIIKGDVEAHVEWVKIGGHRYG